MLCQKVEKRGIDGALHYGESGMWSSALGSTMVYRKCRRALRLSEERSETHDSLPCPAAPLPSRDSWESSGVSVAIPTQIGEAQRCSETVGRGREHERCHRWEWLQDSSYLGLGGLDQWPCLGIKHLVIVPVCPQPPLTLDLIPCCLGKPGSQRRCE